MRNQPKYHFFKNTNYALAGLLDMLKHEMSFKLELIVVAILLPVIVFIDANMTQKLILFMTLMGMPLAEAMNSAIERVVDLVTLEHHDMAKRAKDVGSTIVFLSIMVFITVWVFTLYNLYL